MLALFAGDIRHDALLLCNALLTDGNWRYADRAIAPSGFTLRGARPNNTSSFTTFILRIYNILARRAGLPTAVAELSGWAADQAAS